MTFLGVLIKEQEKNRALDPEAMLCTKDPSGGLTCYTIFLSVKKEKRSYNILCLMLSWVFLIVHRDNLYKEPAELLEIKIQGNKLVCLDPRL